MFPRLLLNALAVVAALLLGLTACSSEDDASAPSSDEPFNEADVAFATDMIPHHAQALSMVDLSMGRDLSPEVAALTEEIRAAQGPEIETMADWLEDWDQPVPETMRDHANAHGDMGEMDMHEDMPGMMSAEEMTALEDASDAEFEELWLEMMVEHHEGAVEMAQTELEDGKFPAAISLAKRIVDAQQKEISHMQDLLDD